MVSTGDVLRLDSDGSINKKAIMLTQIAVGLGHPILGAVLEEPSTMVYCKWEIRHLTWLLMKFFMGSA